MLPHGLRRLSVGVLAAVLAFAGQSRPAVVGEAAAQVSPEAPARRVILLAVDGGGDWLVDQFLERTSAPAFERMRREGASADAMVSTLPTLTASAHATLWTGAWPRTHGVSANNVSRLPRAAHTILDSRSGFDSGPLLAEPIWRTAARAGRRVLVLQATQGQPFTRDYADRVLQFDVYGNRLLLPGPIAGRLVNGRHEFTLGQEPFVVRAEPGGMLLLEAREARLDLRPGFDGSFTDPLPIRVGDREGLVRLRLLSYDPAGGAYRIWHGLASQITSNRPERVPDFVRTAGMIVGEEIVDDYRAGRFGPTIGDRGNGDAERWVEHLLTANHEYFARSLDFAANEPWDLLVAYISSFDSGGHALVGMLDPSSSAHTPEHAARAWPALERLFDLTVDRFVADVRRRFPDATLIVVSDHGMEGADSLVLPNVILRKAGLLGITPQGDIDLARTQVLFMQSRGQMLFVNSSDWKGGIVAASDRARVKRAATAALLQARHPVTRVPAIRAVFDADLDGQALGIGGEIAGDLYFDPHPGFYTSGNVRGDAEIIRAPATGYGFHGSAPWRRKLHAIFYAVGAGVEPGRRLGLVRAIDIAPTVASLLGIPKPEHAEGEELRLK
jgi:predicted AlkP superfamily phosphohydrolase/phosphomutase